MTLAIYTDTDSNRLTVFGKSPLHAEQNRRIQTALGIEGDYLPSVDERTHFTYFEYLSENLSFPFTAHYPEPTTPLEEVQYECAVLELLDPSQYVGDPFDGIF